MSASPTIAAMLAEMDQEGQTTRKLLEIVPEDKLSWKPHSTSHSLGQLALHIAQLPEGVSSIAAQDSVEAPDFQQAEAKSRAELLETFDRGLVKAKETLSGMDDQSLGKQWSVNKGDKTVMAIPRYAVLRIYFTEPPLSSSWPAFGLSADTGSTYSVDIWTERRRKSVRIIQEIHHRDTERKIESEKRRQGESEKGLRLSQSPILRLFFSVSLW